MTRRRWPRPSSGSRSGSTTSGSRSSPLAPDEIARRVAALREQAAERLAAVTGADGRPALRVLLTGGTGFVGQEILWQAAHDDDVAEVVVLIRPQEIRDRKTREVVATLSPAERGERLLDRLWLTSADEPPEVPLRRRRRRGAPAGGRRRRLRPPRRHPHPRHPLRRQRLLRRPLPEVLPRQRLRHPQRPRLLAGPAVGAGQSVRRPPGDRDLLHPRPPAAAGGAGGRDRLPPQLLQQLLRADQGDGVDRDRALHARTGAARRPALPGHRHRRVAGRQQPGRHQGGQRAGQRLRPRPPGVRPPRPGPGSSAPARRCSPAWPASSPATRRPS